MTTPSVSTVLAAAYDNADNAALNPYVSSGTFTLEPGRLYVAIVVGRGAVGAPGGALVSVTGTGTWQTIARSGADAVAVSAGATTYVTIAWYHHPVTSSALTSRTLSVAFGGDATGCGYMVAEVIGGYHIDSDAGVRQRQIASGAASATSVATPALVNAPSNGSLLVSGASVQLAEAMTAESGWTSIGAVNGTTPNTSLIGQYRLVPDSDNVASASWTTASSQSAIVVVEFQSGRYPRVILL